MDMRVPGSCRAIGLGLATLVAAAPPSHATDYFSLDLRQAEFAREPLGPAAQFVPPPAPAPALQDERLRLRFDRETATSPAQSTGTAGAKTEQMIALRKRLDRAFRDAGLSYELFVDDQQILHGAQPSLVVSGDINRKAIYRINNATDIVKIAREAGFRSLVFYDQAGERGAYVFDLEKANPCTRTVCL
jgi:hypothetical protein